MLIIGKDMVWLDLLIQWLIFAPEFFIFIFFIIIIFFLSLGALMELIIKFSFI